MKDPATKIVVHVAQLRHHLGIDAGRRHNLEGDLRRFIVIVRDGGLPGIAHLHRVRAHLIGDAEKRQQIHGSVARLSRLIDEGDRSHDHFAQGVAIHLAPIWSLKAYDEPRIRVEEPSRSVVLRLIAEVGQALRQEYGLVLLVGGFIRRHFHLGWSGVLRRSLLHEQRKQQGEEAAPGKHG